MLSLWARRWQEARCCERLLHGAGLLILHRSAGVQRIVMITRMCHLSRQALRQAISQSGWRWRHTTTRLAPFPFLLEQRYSQWYVCVMTYLRSSCTDQCSVRSV